VTNPIKVASVLGGKKLKFAGRLDVITENVEMFKLLYFLDFSKDLFIHES
jgi:hypothetical protein